MEKELILVYNADSSIFAAATDFVKKIAAPDKYDCQLCKVTYGAIKMKHPWKEYLDRLPHKKTFLHRDEFKKLFPSLSASLPTLMIRENQSEQPKTLLSSEEINATKNLQELITLLEQKIH